MFRVKDTLCRHFGPGLIAAALLATVGIPTSGGAQSAAPSDSQFASKAASGGIAEVKLGQLAEEKGTTPEVRNFGKRMVADHSKADDQLQMAAGKAGIKLPSDMSAADRAEYMKLKALSGTRFDRAYAAAMVKDHQHDVAQFQNEANSGKHDPIQSFAAQTLPVLQEHLQLAQKMANSVGASAELK